MTTITTDTVLNTLATAYPRDCEGQFTGYTFEGLVALMGESEDAVSDALTEAVDSGLLMEDWVYGGEDALYDPEMWRDYHATEVALREAEEQYTEALRDCYSLDDMRAVERAWMPRLKSLGY